MKLLNVLNLSFPGVMLVALLATPLAQAQTRTLVQGASGAAQGSSPFQGLYLELRPIGGSLAAVHYYFWKDGRYCDGLPAGGLEKEPADFEALKSQLRCGQYSFSGRTLHLKPQGEGEARQIRVDTPGGRLSFDGHATQKVAPLPAPGTLKGTYTAMVMGSMMTRQAYVFGADGRYLFTSTPLSAEDGSPASQRGQYTVSGNMLQLSDSPAGGATGIARLTAYPYPGGGVMIEGTVFAP